MGRREDAEGFCRCDVPFKHGDMTTRGGLDGQWAVPHEANPNEAVTLGWFTNGELTAHLRLALTPESAQHCRNDTQNRKKGVRV